ncbi:MAG: hypothetical protein ACOVN5_10670, partial [Aquidulcibacter sp.]
QGQRQQRGATNQPRRHPHHTLADATRWSTSAFTNPSLGDHKAPLDTVEDLSGYLGSPFQSVPGSFRLSKQIISAKSATRSPTCRLAPTAANPGPFRPKSEM